MCWITLQVLVRWALQHGTVVIPKASSESHLRSNLEALDWELPQEDYKALSSLKFQVRLRQPPRMQHAQGDGQCSDHVLCSREQRAPLIRSASRHAWRCCLTVTNQNQYLFRAPTAQCCLPLVLSLVPAFVLQARMVDGSMWLAPEGPYKTLDELWGQLPPLVGPILSP